MQNKRSRNKHMVSHTSLFFTHQNPTIWGIFSTSLTTHFNSQIHPYPHLELDTLEEENIFLNSFSHRYQSHSSCWQIYSFLTMKKQQKNLKNFSESLKRIKILNLITQSSFFSNFWEHHIRSSPNNWVTTHTKLTTQYTTSQSK